MGVGDVDVVELGVEGGVGEGGLGAPCELEGLAAVPFEGDVVAVDVGNAGDIGDGAFGEDDDELAVDLAGADPRGGGGFVDRLAGEEPSRLRSRPR